MLIATCLLMGGRLYGIHGNDGRDARLKCLDFATGEVRWTYEGLGLGNIMAAGGRFLALPASIAARVITGTNQHDR